MGQGCGAVRRRSNHRRWPPDRHRSLLRRDGRSAGNVGRQQAIRRARDKISAIQLLRHGAGQLPHWRERRSGPKSPASEIARSEQNIRDCYYFKKRDPVTGVVSKSQSGYFMNDSEYAGLHTEQRVGLTKDNPKELEQWANVFIFDIYGMVVELQKDDPKNLYRRLTQIKAPIFLAFGAKEPFIPGTALNGLKDLAGDIIVPFTDRMTLAGNRPTVKVYPDTGHFIHTDNPVEFPNDVVEFVTTGRIVVNSPVAIDRLVNGAANEAVHAVAPTPP